MAFPPVMAAGGLIGISGASVLYPEQMIALSGPALGLMVAFRVRMALWAAAMLVTVFALFHGYSHGCEMPRAANAASFAIGFVVATGLLHVLGISIGVVDRSRIGQRAIQGLGVAIAAVGGFFVVTTLMTRGLLCLVALLLPAAAHAHGISPAVSDARTGGRTGRIISTPWPPVDRGTPWMATKQGS